jgi:hypothetical protein
MQEHGINSGKTIIMRYHLFLSSLFILAALHAGADAAFMSTGSTNNGYASAQSASFASNSAAGAISGSKSSSPGFSSAPGVFPAVEAAAAAPTVNSVQFENDSSVQRSSTVVCKVTVETGTSTWITTVSYRTSNSGTAVFTNPLVPAFQVTSGTDTADILNVPSRLSFALSLPASLFTTGSNNYIQWKAFNAAGVSAVSSAYQIVLANNRPGITITQPDVKTGIASTTPQIEAILTSDVGIVPSALSVSIARVGGAVIGTYTPAYSVSTNKLSFAYNGTPLSDGVSYTLTISATDTLGGNSTKTQTFTVKGGAIADLVPYPSPFDPARGPVKLNYTLSRRADVTVNIYNMGRKLVKNIIDNQARGAGTFEETWDGTNYAGDTMANGVYFCEVIAKDSEGEHRRYTALAILGK